MMLLVLAVAVGAVADGLNERNKDAGHLFEPFEKPILLSAGVVAMFCGGWFHALFTIIVAYTAFRVAFFDPIKNKAADQPLFYHGSVGWWDKFLSKNSSVPAEIGGRFLFLVLAVFLMIRL